MALYLAQHGHSLPEEDDPNRGLCDQGLMEVQFVADLARDRDVPVSRILHSGKKRAYQTARIFAAELIPGVLPEVMDGLNPMDDVTRIAELINPDSNEMLVGHLPFLEKLVSYLVIGSVETPVLQFQNGGIACLDKLPKNGPWVIKWTLYPGV